MTNDSDHMKNFYVTFHNKQLQYVWDDSDFKEYVTFYQDKNLKRRSRRKSIDPKVAADQSKALVNNMLKAIKKDHQ